MRGVPSAAMKPITPADLSEWRRTLPEDGDHLDPTLAQEIAPRLMDEVERLWSELARLRRADGSRHPRPEGRG